MNESVYGPPAPPEIDGEEQENYDHYALVDEDEFGPYMYDADEENDRVEREKSIKENRPAKFKIEENPEAKDKLDAIDETYHDDARAKAVVVEHDKDILKYAQKHNIDPDVIRSVMYAENARGHKLGVNSVADKMGLSESIMPMNIQQNRWSSLIDKTPGDMYDPAYNIEAVTLLLRRISDRIEKPTPAKVGSIWNYIGREKTNEFGEYVGKVYEYKPWRRAE